MFSEHELNMLYIWCINRNVDFIRNKTIYTDIHNLLKISTKSDCVPKIMDLKIMCLRDIVEVILQGKSPNFAVDTICTTGRYSGNIHRAFVEFSQNQEISDEQAIEIGEVIDGLRQNAVIDDNIEDLYDDIDELKNNDYTGIPEKMKLMYSIEARVKSMSNALTQIRPSSTEGIDLGTESSVKVFDSFMQSSIKINRIPTGFKYLDDNIFEGGFEQERVYLIGGSSGSGKSTLLTNMALNAATNRYYVGNLKTKFKIFLYITLENKAKNTVSRMMCSWWGITKNELITKGRSLGSKIVSEQFDKELEAYNSTVPIRYCPTKSINSMKIGGMIEELTEKYGGTEKCILAAVYLDYLDLITSNNNGNQDSLRLQLGEITEELSNLSSEYNIPVITATQLNRSAYGIKSAYDLREDQMSESMKKLHTTDFFSMMARHESDPDTIFFRVGKNRDGAVGHPVDFKVDFSKFKFIECKKAEPPNGKKDKPKDPGLMKIECNGNEVPPVPFSGMESI